MHLRESLLSLVATPERAWFTLLVGVVLICRELTAPGRILPGILGGVVFLTAANAIAEYRLTLQGFGLFAAGVSLIVLQALRKWHYAPGAAAVGSMAAGTRLLLAPPGQLSWRAAVATAAVTLICTFLFRIAIQARRSKVSLE
jgi:membrane-bound serine protease (ClpP class)